MRTGKLTAGGAALRLPEEPTAVGRVIEAAVYILLAVFFVCVAVLTAAGLESAWRAVLTTVIFVSALCAVCAAERREALALAVILALAAALRTGYIIAVPTQPVSDFALLYSSAQSAAAGDMSWADVTEGYFSWWQYQIPFVLYEAAILRLVPSMAALKMMNVVWGVGSVYLVWRIVSRFMPGRCALAAALMLAVYPAHLMYSSVLTNQHISLFFVLLALAVLIETSSPWGCALAGALLAVGDLMRPEGLVPLAAAFCCALCAVIEQPRKKRALSLLVTLAALAAAYFAVKCAAGLILGALGLAPHGIGNSVPEWKLVVGLDRENGGTVSDEYIYILNLADPAARRAAGRDIIARHLSARGGWAAFFLAKLRYFWASAEDLTFTLSGVNVWDSSAVGGMSIEDMVYTLSGVEYIWRIAAYCLAAAGCAHFARSAMHGAGRSTSAAPLLIAAILCGTVLVYLAIEVQPRYRFFAMPFVFMLASVPFSRLRKKQK